MIDKIVINEGSGDKTIGVKDWLALELVKRVNLVAKRQVTFFEGGATILARDAVNQLRAVGG